MTQAAPRAIIDTKFGEIELEFFPDKAKGHVQNFLDLARKGSYDGTTFHRVIPGFMIQGGDPNTKDPNGIRLATKTFGTSLSTPGSTSTIFASKLVAAVLDGCPAIQKIVHDPDSVGAIARADNGVLALMTDPTFVTALAANPAALGTFNAAQAGLAAGMAGKR